MQSNTKRSQRDYTLAFKYAVVDQVEKGEMTYKQAQDRYGIQGRSTVLTWLRRYGKLDWSQGISSAKTRVNSMSEQPSKLSPDQRIKELEKQLEETKLKAEFFEAVVQVMEQDYGVRVSKKPRTKSSKKT